MRSLQCLAAVGCAVTASALTDTFKPQSQLQLSKSCCAALSNFLPGKVFAADSGNYNSSLSSYWSTQEQEVTPKCIVIPTEVKDVQTSLFLVNKAFGLGFSTCQLAIRSGGHSPQAGAANIQDGVTLDLSKLNQVTVSQDKSQVTLGPGNRWVDVYSKLDPLGLSTAGGRVAFVGVGGLVLGGGISYFSGRYGFVCDTVVSYQVVLANGELVTASSSSNPDLFKALKGGSNNFGVVTAITAKLFQQGDFWGGFVGHNISEREKQFQFFEKFANSATYDPFSALILGFGWTPDQGWANANFFEYTKAVSNFNDTAAFKDFNSLPAVHSTLRLSNMTDFAQEQSGFTPGNNRQMFVTMTIKNSAKMLSTFFNLTDATVHALPADSGLTVGIAFQPIPQTIISKGAGENSLGLDGKDGDLTNVLLSAKWQDAKNDAAITKAAMSLLSEAESSAQKLKVFHPYRYLNYAAPWQDVIASYGSRSVDFLQEVSKRFDPHGFFQKSVPGGFKLGLYKAI